MTSWKRQVKNRFSEQATEWAACYADPEPTLSGQHLISRQRFALEMVESAIPPSSRILEAGCGAGVMAAKLIKRGYAVWGIDLAEPMIRQARQLCDSEPFGVGDIEHIPFPDNTFDVVVSLGVMEYLESDEQALREVWRVLKPGGRAVIAIPNGSYPLRRLDVVVPRVVAVLRVASARFTSANRSSRSASTGFFTLDANSVSVVDKRPDDREMSSDALRPRSAVNGAGMTRRDSPAASVSSTSGVGAEKPAPYDTRLVHAPCRNSVDTRGLMKLPNSLW